MTNNEAIARLKVLTDYEYDEDLEALDIAIKALEQQPCEDLINQRATTCRHGGHCEWVACDKCNHYEPDPLSQQSCEDCISRKAVLETIECCNNDGLKGIFCSYNDGKRFEKYIKELPSVTPKEKTGCCKDCKYFEYDRVAKVNGIPLIIGHEICSKWSNGCKTKEDGYCFLFEPQESEDKE